MSKSLYIFILLALSLTQASCSLFSTRSPEEPSGNNTNFQQPTSELVVLSNFQSAVQENNTENFMRCLADTSLGARVTFRFEPSSEALASYAEQFRQWSLQNERQAFYSMSSKVDPSSQTKLQLLNARFEVRVPDSALYVADYILRVSHSSASIAKVVAGTMRLTIVPNQLNQWSIERWIDTRSSISDSIPVTWSTLKAQFSN